MNGRFYDALEDRYPVLLLKFRYGYQTNLSCKNQALLLMRQMERKERQMFVSESPGDFEEHLSDCF